MFGSASRCPHPLNARFIQRHHLVLQLLCEAIRLVQGKPGDKLCGQDMAAAQLIYHLRYIEERMVLQQLPGSDRWTDVNTDHATEREALKGLDLNTCYVRPT